MDVISGEDACKLIGENGGRVYVWVRSNRCGGRALASGFVAPPSVDFRLVAEVNDFELFLPQGLRRLPDELHFEVKRFPKRIETYWNGCAWIV